MGGFDAAYAAHRRRLHALSVRRRARPRHRRPPTVRQPVDEAEDVRQFTAFSGDDQTRHVEEDAEGWLMVQGLLTATLPTEIGGKLEVMAHHLDLVPPAGLHRREDHL